MQKKRKNFRYYWNFVEVPVFILILWSIIGLALPIKNYIPGWSYNVISWAITIFIFGYIGYAVVKEKSNEPKDSAKAGAYAGAIAGLVGAIISIIAFHFSPGMFNEALQQMIQGGLDAGSASTFLKIGIYSSIITAPLFSAIIGALISWISGLIFRNK